MSLFWAELRKVWGNRLFPLLLAVLAAANLLLLWMGTRPTSGQPSAAAYRAVGAQLDGLTMEEKGAYLHGKYTEIESLVKIGGFYRDMAYAGNSYLQAYRDENAAMFDAYEQEYKDKSYTLFTDDLNTEYRLFNQLQNEYDTVASYTDFLDGHLVYNRAVRTLETCEIVGYITFLYDDQGLKERLDVIAGNNNGFLGLYDSKNDVLICRDNIDKEAYLQALADQDLSDAQGGITFTVDGIGKMLLCSNEVMNDGWYFLSAVSNDDIYEMHSLLVLMILSFAVIAILLILSITVLNHTIITGPIAHIMDAVKKIQNEDYDISLDIHTGDEIEILADNLNIMARRIDELVNQNLKANLAYKEMQITQLQHQIKPHFLYNTLECINALSQLGRTEDVRIITSAFAKLMKNRMSDANFTTVKEEQACVDAFLQIYQTMQAGQLNYSITVDPQCEGLRIPRMIVQPLVENAVLHGIVPSARLGTCTVEVYRENEHLCIQVSDDGVGLSRETLESVNRYIEGKANEDDKKNLGIGTRNVVDRIRYVYGASGSISVLSDAEWGTSITLMLPIEENQ